MMTPIPAVVTVDISEDVETALRRCVSSGHTRLVVTEDENQRPRPGHRARQLARPHAAWPRARSASIEALVTRGADRPRDQAARRPARRPPAPALVAGRRRSTSTAASAGIVTVEDIIEEVVGEIDDETDPAGGEVRRLANGDWFVRGHVAITDLLDYGLELPVDTDAYNSVGGFVFAELGRLPKRGDTVTRQRLLDPRRVGAREPDRGGAHPRAPRGTPRPTRRRLASGPTVRRQEVREFYVRGCVAAADAANAGGVDKARAARWEEVSGQHWWIRVGPTRTGTTSGRAARAARCFWEEVHLRGTFAWAVSHASSTTPKSVAKDRSGPRQRVDALRSRPRAAGKAPASAGARAAPDGTVVVVRRGAIARTSGTGTRTTSSAPSASPSRKSRPSSSPRTGAATRICALRPRCGARRARTRRARRRSRSARASRRR